MLYGLSWWVQLCMSEMWLETPYYTLSNTLSVPISFSWWQRTYIPWNIPLSLAWVCWYHSWHWLEWEIWRLHYTQLHVFDGNTIPCCLEIQHILKWVTTISGSAIGVSFMGIPRRQLHQMHLSKACKVDLWLFIYSDHPVDKVTRMSRSRFMAYMNITVIPWYLKKQLTIETSIFRTEISLNYAASLVIMMYVLPKSCMYAFVTLTTVRCKKLYGAKGHTILTYLGASLVYSSTLMMS